MEWVISFGVVIAIIGVMFLSGTIAATLEEKYGEGSAGAALVMIVLLIIFTGYAHQVIYG